MSLKLGGMDINPPARFHGEKSMKSKMQETLSTRVGRTLRLGSPGRDRFHTVSILFPCHHRRQQQ